MCHRFRQIRIGNFLPNFLSISSGVPQAITGLSYCFCCAQYINDVRDSVGLLNCSIKLYAGDAKLYSSFHVEAHSTDLVKAVDSVTECANMWQLKTVTSKCIAQILISARCQLSSNDCPHTLCNMPLQWSLSTKYLGVTMDNGLVFDQHAANIVRIASTRVDLILGSLFLEIMKSLSKPMLPMYDPSWNTVLMFGLHIVLT